MEILKKIVISNNKRPIILHTESRNDTSLSKTNQTTKTNYANNIAYNKSSYVNIQSSKIKLRKNIPKGKMNISFCKKGINSNNEQNKECKLISYIDLGNNKSKKYIQNKKDKSHESKHNYTFKKDLIINNNITNNISNHITNIILTNNNNSHLGQKNSNNNKEPNRVDNKKLVFNKKNEASNDLSQRFQKNKRIMKNTKLERNSYNKINNYKCDLTSRTTKNENNKKTKEISANCIRIITKKLNLNEKEKKTKYISERNKNNINTYYTNYINSSSHLNINNTTNSNVNIPTNNKSKKNLIKYKNLTNNIELNLNTKKLKPNSINKLIEFKTYNSNSKTNLIKFNPSMKYLEDSFLSLNSLNSNRNKNDNDKNINNNYHQHINPNKNKQYIFTKIQKQYKPKLNINIKNIKNLNQMRALFECRFSNSNKNTNKSYGEKNNHNYSYINSSLTLLGNMKQNNFKKIHHTLVSSNSKTKNNAKNNSKEPMNFKYQSKNKNELINNIYKNYKTDRSFGNNNTYTNDESSNINIINIINNFNKKNISNKSFLANYTEILKNKTIKGQKRKLSINVSKSIKQYFLSKSLQKNFDISNTYINYKNDNYNSYREQYLYNKANSYRNISYISKEKSAKNYSKRRNPKYYSNQKKIHNKKIIINRKKNRCKKDNIEYNAQKNDLVNLIKNKKKCIIKKKLLKRNPKSTQNYSKEVYILIKNRNDNGIKDKNYSKETRETYNSIPMKVLKNILGVNEEHSSPKTNNKNNLMKSYNNNIKKIQGGDGMKHNKSLKINEAYNNITSLNKMKKINIEDILYNKVKNKNKKRTNKEKKEFIRKTENIQEKLINKENELDSKDKDKDKIDNNKPFHKSKTNQNIKSNIYEISLNKKEKKEELELQSENEINSEIKNNPQYLAEYIFDILENLLIDESSYVSQNYINSNYLFSYNEDIELTPEIRSISINWLIMIIYKIFKFKENTLFLSVQITDRFLSKKMLSVEKTELLILCSLILSSKHEEIDYVNMVESLQLASNKFTKEEIINMQYEILSELNFELIIPTMSDYFSIYCTILNLNEIDINKGTFLLNIVLVDYHIIKYPNFLISLAVVKLVYNKSINSLITKIRYFLIKNNQENFLEMINEEKLLDKVCSKIKKIYKRYLENKYKNIQEKFSDEKYNSVANISSELIDISNI